MASRYYNPRLAQKVGAAEAPMYTSISGAVEKGRIAYERETVKQLQKKQIEMQQRQAEAAAFKKEMERRDDILYNITKQQEKISKPIELLPAQLKGIATSLAEEAKIEYLEIQKAIQKGLLTKGQAAIEMENGPNAKINKINSIISGHAELIENANFKKPSVVNDSKSLKITNKLIEGNYNVNKDGEIVIMDDDNKTILQKIPLSEANKVNYIEEDTEAFNNAFVSLNSAMDSAAKSGKRWESAKREIDLIVDQLNFTPEQALSIAFDYLGKERPEYANLKNYQNKDGSINIEGWKKTIDADDDGIFGEDEDLNKWVKDQLKEVAENSYEGYKKDYKDKFDTDKNNTSENIATAGIEDIEKALTDFNFSILNGKTINGRKVENTEIKNGKLIINYIARTSAEGQEIAESEPIDLNSETAIKSLIGEYVKSIYGGDKNVDEAILLLRNKNVKTFKQSAQEKSILFPSPSTKKQLP